MSSTHLLRVGATGNLSSFKAAWLKYNHDSGYDIKVSHNILKPVSRYFSVCNAAPKTGWKKEDACCKVHLKLKGTTREAMVCVSINLNHSCSGTEKRKQNYRMEDISEVSPVLDLYQPTAKKEGNAKQFMAMAKEATGLSVKVGQASRVIRSKSHDTIEATIGQYMWVPSLFDAYRDMDPLGTYKYEAIPCPWDEEAKQFSRCYVSMSPAKHFWSKACIDLVICDGTFTRSRSGFKHVVLIAVTFDGNNQLVILGFAIVGVEDAANWTWFKECLELDFPGIRVWMSDADKGIYSNQFSVSLSQSISELTVSRCIRHLAENTRENCNGRMKLVFP